jgi:hypothetical protein
MEPGFENVRIHSYGYDSDWGKGKVSVLNVHDFGQALLGDIQNSPHIQQSVDVSAAALSYVEISAYHIRLQLSLLAIVWVG